MILGIEVKWLIFGVNVLVVAVLFLFGIQVYRRYRKFRYLDDKDFEFLEKTGMMISVFSGMIMFFGAVAVLLHYSDLGPMPWGVNVFAVAYTLIFSIGPLIGYIVKLNQIKKKSRTQAEGWMHR